MSWKAEWIATLAIAETLFLSISSDAALNELGMLSTTTTVRQQYLREQAARRRNASSEPGLTRNYSEPIGLDAVGGACLQKPGATDAVSPTPSNSPSRALMGPGYQIVSINPQFVTSLTASSPPSNSLSPTSGPPTLAQLSARSRVSGASIVARASRTEPEEVTLRVVEFGTKYSQDSLERERHATRTQRAKLSRLKRFKKPYEVPWRHQIEKLYQQSPVGSPSQSVGGLVNRPYNSNSTSPEKSDSLANEVCTVTRSKSLDEIDFNKLRLAEGANHNLTSSTSVPGREIDNMAQHLQNLQVNE